MLTSFNVRREMFGADADFPRTTARY